MGSLAHEAYEAIKRDIIRTRLDPGQKIIQSELSDRYAVGTTPIREALQRLAQEGLVEPVPRYGYIVARITLYDVRELFELRVLLESASCRWAATRGDMEDLEAIRQVADFIYVKGDEESYSVYLSANRDFHRSIAFVSGNHRLVPLITQVLDEMTRILYVAILHDLERFDVFVREHVDLADALCDRDPDLAEELIRAEIELTQKLVLDALIESGRQPTDAGRRVHAVPH